MRDPFIDVDALGRRRGEPEVLISLTCTNLARRLREAADAHHIYEKGLAAPDPDWPVWYAAYIDRSLRSILVSDGTGGYRGMTQEELIEKVTHDLHHQDPFRATVAREVRMTDAFAAGQGVVEEGKARLEALDEAEREAQSVVVTPLSITCNDGEAAKDEESAGLVSTILNSLRREVLTCGPSDDLGPVEEEIREEERDRVRHAFEEAFKAGEDTMARLIREGKVVLGPEAAARYAANLDDPPKFGL